ncbi:high affinity immunoglobulin epsilon receptor subunit alpha-like [Xenopus laevis]|uniref:high affinity immunoglobulin epsilon receptor subunit alpha-like n=1 Tax=Xenopus laevis TaxID=8355 RepID=UPI001BB11BBC|nr:high affinity immunoglobulin epsilon receptor subunit alpha-like [Xenopus laevis]
MGALVLMPLLFIGMDTAGAAVRPAVISFSPNWTPIFSGESVTLTCNVAPTAQGNLRYSWYRDGYRISGDQRRLVIQAASWSDRGNYKCQAGASEKSEYFRLAVMSSGELIRSDLFPQSLSLRPLQYSIGIIIVLSVYLLGPLQSSGQTVCPHSLLGVLMNYPYCEGFPQGILKFLLNWKA